MPSRPPFILLRTKFHTSSHLPSPEPSHYETLNLSTSATRAAIKARFYELSKSHHPDRNWADPHASKKFIKISNAYSILGNPASREKYDRELQRLHPSGPRSSPSNPVGGRPASGLSRRRTQPHGPPPSFFRNGGWTAFRGSHDTGPGFSSSGGMGVGGEGGANKYDVPHFNWDGKYKQHELHEQRRRGRRSQSSGVSHDRPMIIQVFAVSCILIFTVWSAAFGAKRKEENNKKKK
ncbi:DnaJ domain-containing protein [Trichophaea hybrida]|nr:DnaJ domain-containing protein [Trichophaea hybrida]